MPWLLLLLVGLAAPSAFAQEDERVVEVIDLSGPIDDRIARFAASSIEAAADGGVEVVILQIDSPGVVRAGEGFDRLMALAASPPLPLVAWIGPAPAVAYGGAAQLVAAAPLALAAPGSEIGHWVPTVAGSDDPDPLIPAPAGLFDEAVAVESLVGSVFARVGPETAAPRQVAQLLDGTAVATASGPVDVRTIRTLTLEDGTEGPSVLPTIIREPGLWDAFLRLAATPEATFFFLVAGLTVAAFEFYAIGPGIAAGVASVSLVLAGYGLSVLPVRWWAVAVVVAAVAVLAWSYQAGGVLALAVLGLVALLVSGFSFTNAAPQIAPGAAGVLLTVAGAAFFFLLAMPTVARSRFSTQTIGREGLLGRAGVARSPIDPDGEVEVDGATWMAHAHREAGLAPGDPVTVVGVDGWFLEVEPAGREKSD